MNKTLRQIFIALAAAYLLEVVLIVDSPTPIDRQAAGTLHEVLPWLYRHGMSIDYNVVKFSAGIVFKNAVAGIFLGSLSSCLVEGAQAFFLPDRIAAGLDVLANTLGAGLLCFDSQLPDSSA